MDTIIVSR